MKIDFKNLDLNVDLKNAAKRFAKVQSQLRSRSEPLIKQIRSYAQVQTKEWQRQLKTSKDVKRVLTLLQKRRKDVEKLVDRLPKEVKVVRSYLVTQVKELEGLANKIVSNAQQTRSNFKGAGLKSRSASSKRKTTTKKSAAKVRR